MGLLSKAANVGSQKKLSFAEFFFSHKIKTAAVFQKKENEYFITNSIGFDGLSIISSKSTQDFWNGIYKESNGVKKFSSKDGSISPLLQFFSFSMTENLSELSLYKFSEDKIFLLCNEEITDSIKKDLKSIDRFFSVPKCENLNSFIKQETKCVSCTIDFEEAIESFFKLNLKDKSNTEIYKNAVFNEMANRIISFTNIDACRILNEKKSNSKIKAVFITNENTPFSLIMVQLIMNLRFVLMECAELTEILQEDECKTFLQLKSFLEED